MVPITAVLTRTIDITTDPTCSSIMDPDMILSSSPGPDDTMALDGCVDYSDQDVFGGSMVLG